ncbi:MAG: hypothetical protein HYV26_10260 [Candidatus Hydrogenedentes bacterium]|nr:hypothetical protein [Candidatus Hydrogenedentota bacterium]
MCLLAGVAGLCLAGCATKRSEKPAAPSATTPSRPSEPFPTVTLEQDYGTLGELVRRVGEDVGGGLVLMHGLEPAPAPIIHLKNVPYAQLISQITEETGQAAQQNPHYYFVYSPAPVYNSLLSQQLGPQLPEHYRALTVSAAFGGGTALYNVLATISRSLGVTLVADNVISDAACGELTLPEAPLPDVLDAVFKSALLPPEAYQIEATEDYVLFLNARSPVLGPTLLNESALSETQRQQLEKRVDLEVAGGPNGSTDELFTRGDVSLHEVLGALSTQCGMTVTCTPALVDFPVTWTVMHQVPMRVALDLLIRQWPVAQFGYEVTEAGILIRER